MLKEKVPGREMKALIDRLYGKYPKGLVANIQKGEVPKRVKSLAKYLAKYVVSPPLSVRRIELYDGQRVKYWYNDHPHEDLNTVCLNCNVSAVEIFVMLKICKVRPKGVKF
jgi:hypothetical protein